MMTTYSVGTWDAIQETMYISYDYKMRCVKSNVNC